MFGTLFESRAVTSPRTGSSIASILIHGLIIGGGVIATAKDIVTPLSAPPVIHMVPFMRPVGPPPPEHRTAATPPATSVTAIPEVRRLNVPAIVPLGLPPMNLAAGPMPLDFAPTAVKTSGILCDAECSATAPTDSAGRQVWSARDVLMRLLEEPVPPRYPEALRRAGVEGDVVVRFVVDSTGRVDMRTIEVLRSTHGAFSDAVRETLARLRFAPASTGERNVRALAVMPFHFTLR